MTKSLFKYQNKTAFAASTERPDDRSTVSLASKEVIYVGKNVILPYRKSTAEYADKVIWDREDKCLRVIKYGTYDAEALANATLSDGTTPRFWWGGAVHFGFDQGKAIAVDAKCMMDGNSETMTWADMTYFRVTGFSFENNALAEGSLTLTVRTGDFNSTVALTWAAGATLAEVAADANTKRNGKTSFGFVALDDGLGLGVWMNTYSYNTLTTSDEGFTIECTKICDAEGNDTATDAKPQITTCPTYDSRMKTAGTSIIRNNGATSTSSPACIDQTDYYMQSNGLQVFKKEDEATIPMRRTVWATLSGYAIGTPERTLYDRYHGDYVEYLEHFLVDPDSTIGAMAESVNDMWMMTYCMAQLYHKDYNGNVRPMYLPAWKCFNYAPADTPDDAVAFFGQGCHLLPSNRVMAQLAKDISRNGTTITTGGREDKLNISISEFNGSRVIKGSETIWTSCEANGYSAWCLYGNYGYLYYNYSKYGACRVRGVLAFDIED